MAYRQNYDAFARVELYPALLVGSRDKAKKTVLYKTKKRKEKTDLQLWLETKAQIVAIVRYEKRMTEGGNLASLQIICNT